MLNNSIHNMVGHATALEAAENAVQWVSTLESEMGSQLLEYEAEELVALVELDGSATALTGPRHRIEVWAL